MAYDYLSAQLTNADAVPKVMNNPNTSGRVYCEFFSYTVPAGDLAVGKTLELVRLRKGMRPISGKFSCTALSTGGGTAGVTIGDGTTANKYLAETSVDGVSNIEFLAKQSEYNGVELSQDTSIVATVASEAWAAAGTITGYVKYLGGH
jgi:hypothetical protein